MKRTVGQFLLTSLILLTVTLFQNCGGAGGGGGGSNSAASGDWYYHFDCNGDPGCLSTNFTGGTYGDSNMGPVYSSCQSMLTFANINWSSPASNWCDHSPTGSVGGGGTGGLGAPTFSSMSASSGAPGTSIVQIYGTHFPTSTSLVTATYCGRTLQVTYSVSTQVTVKIPYMAACKSPITLTTAAGSVNTTPYTVLVNFRAVAASGTQTVITGDWGSIMTSTNGSTWVPRASGVSTSINSNLNTVNWNGTQFMTGGDNLYNLRSSDGITWAQLHVGGLLSYMSLIYTGSQYVAVGSGSTAVTSPDGGTWTTGASIPYDLYYSVAYNGSTYVAAGGSAIYSSGDASTWTARVTPAASRAVAWNGSEFKVVGSAGDFWVSSDGITWLASNTGQSFELLGITAHGAQFVAVGKSGTILTYNGVGGWVGQTSGTSQHLYGVAWTGSMYVAVGAQNTIVTSPDGVTWTVRSAF